MSKGFTTLIIVMIITTAGLAMVTSAVWLGVGGMEMAQAWSESDSAFDMADGCMENALEILKFDNNYNGEILSQDDKSCIITVNKIGSPMTSANLDVVGIKGNYRQKISIFLEVVGDKFNIVSWQENKP
jgi:hypothetical protein